MTVITHARRKSRLAGMIDSAGGVSIGVALERARTNIADLRARGLAEVARQIETLAAIRAPTDPAETGAALRQIYRTASDLIDAAAPFDLPEICTVAISLCDVVDRAGAGGDFDWRILEVHIQSLRLLNALPPEAATEKAEITARLGEMVTRKLGQAG